MERELLLEKIKSQNQELDERETQIKDISYRWAYWGVMFVLALIYVFRMIKGIDFEYDLVMIMMGQSGFMSYSLYRSGRNKRMNLIFIIISTILFIGATYLTLGYYEIF